tara:strand:- start:2717 stop:3283 length:567 start_codon:yes stop_codon:yes gene_type:complete
MIIEYLKTPLNKYTFSIKPIRDWVEENAKGKVLNLFAGKTKLNLNEVRVDADKTMIADWYGDAFDFIKQCKDKFDTVVLDPPYAYRKSMEMYNGHKASKFNMIKDLIKNNLNKDGIVITFGYHSVSMGESRGFKQDKILLMSHGGAIHDTIAVVECRSPEQDAPSDEEQIKKEIGKDYVKTVGGEHGK